MTQTHNDIGVVAIGRNEGARLERCLRSIVAQGLPLVYVDSGSSDGSVDFAQGNGVPVVSLDMSVPFTAARARNAGYAALMTQHPDLAFVQFLDGDCVLHPDWIAAARTAMDTDPTLGVVTGWRSELHPEASVYNAMCDVEWHAPAGPITACGGDMCVRRTAFEAVGGFNEQVIAAEDDAFCLRIAQEGFALRRLALQMTAHDADMHRFGQWWKRATRAGHGFAQVGDLYPGYFAGARKRVLVYGALLPGVALIGLAVSPLLAWAVLGVYGLSYVRTALGLGRSHPDLAQGQRWHHAVFLTLSKFPNLIGFLQYYLRKRRGAAMRIIEYK